MVYSNGDGALSCVVYSNGDGALSCVVYSNGDGALLFLVCKCYLVYLLNLVYRKSNPVIYSGIEQCLHFLNSPCWKAHS